MDLNAVFYLRHEPAGWVFGPTPTAAAARQAAGRAIAVACNVDPPDAAAPIDRLRQNGLFWSFSYVCPEPVLVKSSFIYRYIWLKTPVCSPSETSAQPQEGGSERSAIVISVPFTNVCPEPVLVTHRSST